ncbi:hypothetical protein D3C80_1428130 [compost metagenome]
MFALLSASVIIEPARSAELATILNARSTSPRFCSIGMIAPIDSEPNNCVASADCSSTGCALMACSTSMIVAGASCCICLARSSGSIPRLSQASRWPFVAADPLVSAARKFFMPVPAISFSVPGLSSAADSAALCSGLKPEACPTAP